MNKTALSGNDDKRFVLLDRVRTMAYGHYNIKPELQKVMVEMVNEGKLVIGKPNLKEWRFDMGVLNGLTHRDGWT